MKKLVLVFCLLGLVACQQGAPSEKGSAQPAPQTDGSPSQPVEEPVPAPNPPVTPAEGGALAFDLSSSQISEMRKELSEVLWRMHFETHSLSEKQILVGAALDEAARHLNLTLDWQKATDTDFRKFLSFFFTQDLEFKKEMETP